MKILACVLLLCSTAALAKDHDFHTGKLVSVDTVDRLSEGTTYRRAIFTVQLDDLVYTLKGEAVHHNTDISKGFVVGDPIQAAVEGNNVVLLQPDGKDFKTTIIKRERVPK
jgi:hypothetical protein